MAYPEMTCCVVEEGVRCRSVAGYATFDRRWLKNVSQRRQRYQADPEVREVGCCTILLDNPVKVEILIMGVCIH